jgi:hypothetical protein
VPQLIDYQGSLPQLNGGPVNGSLTLGFGFYDAPKLGNLLYYEQQSPVRVRNGLFHVLIGNGSNQSGSFASIYAGDAVYLGITIDPKRPRRQVVLPRQRIGSAVFALKAGGVDELAARVAELERKLQHVSVSGNDITIAGANLRIVNGLGTTAATNGLGNLIVGYNELREEGGDDRSGSHNVVAGTQHNFTSYGGLVAGWHNTISGEYACVIGGSLNTASGLSAAVSGGRNNTARGDYASVAGGGGAKSTDGNLAFADCSAILGGSCNIVGAPDIGNRTVGQKSTISGGSYNEATGYAACVGGGASNHASGDYASVSGGVSNIASSFAASVSGGGRNEASAMAASVSGGYSNMASGVAASISGGSTRTASGYYDWAAGGLWQDE